MTWERLPLKRALQTGGKSSGLIKGGVSAEPTPGRYPGFSASGQDVWLDEATFHGDGLVLSAVGARCGKVFQAAGAWGTVANTVALLPASGHVARFLWYLTNNESFWEKGGTAQPYVRVEETLNRRVVLPNYSIQRAIVDYLDRETARIDALIAAKQRMMELFDERIKAFVSSRLLSLDSPTALLGQTARIHSGAGFPHEYQGRDSGEWPFYKVADLAGSTDGRTISQAVNWIDAAEARELRCRPAPVNAILFPKVGAALLGNQRRITKVMAAFDNNLMAVTPYAHDSRFLRYWLTLVDLGEMANPGPVPSINEDVIASLRVPIPTRALQVALADELDYMTDEAIRIVGKLGRQIDLISERRQALITAAVTGQLNVQEAA